MSDGLTSEIQKFTTATGATTEPDRGGDTNGGIRSEEAGTTLEGGTW